MKNRYEFFPRNAVYESLILFFYVSAFSPRWNETFTFIIQVPELALIRFAVENQNLIAGNEFLGQYTLPVLCMSKGNIPKSKTIDS